MTSISENISVAALYRFASLPDYERHQHALYACAREAGVKGTLLLASEGINGTIAGSHQGLGEVLEAIRAIPGLEETDVKFSHARTMPFRRLKVRLKREIVTMGIEGIDPRRIVGTYVAPQDWNGLIADPATLLVDTRNAYEVGIGTFWGAEDPATRSFREFPAWINRRLAEGSQPARIAMFCTGGIRCEKATAYVKGLGFDDVYHLKGGILNYLEHVPEHASLWRGACYVFDERVAVGHGLGQSAFKLCHACGGPVAVGAGAGGGFIDGVCARCKGQPEAA